MILCSSQSLNRVELIFLEGGGVVQNFCRVGMAQVIVQQICCFGGRNEAAYADNVSVLIHSTISKRQNVTVQFQYILYSAVWSGRQI